MKSPIPSFLLVLALLASIAIAATEPAQADKSITFANALTSASLQLNPTGVITFADPELQKLAGGKSIDELRTFVKEGVDAKAQVAQLQQQNQQQQIVAEYYKAVAEKNDAVLRVVALQQELTATKAQLATAQAELAAAKKTPEIKK